MVLSDTHPVPPLFLGKVRSAVPEVVAIIGGGVLLPPPDEPQDVGPPVEQAPAVPRGSAATDGPPADSLPPPDAGGAEVPRKRRRW